jgi:hypothetical protein
MVRDRPSLTREKARQLGQQYIDNNMIQVFRNACKHTHTHTDTHICTDVFSVALYVRTGRVMFGSGVVVGG